MKTKSKMRGHIIRSSAYAVFLSVAFIAVSSAFQSPNTWYKSAGTTAAYDTAAKSPSEPRAISFAERVMYQRAIENVYWHNRIWPKENPDPKPSLDAVMSHAQLENTVRGYLRNSLALQDYWQKPITAEQLQAEMDRMARDTKQPEVLGELFEALGNDPAVIAECLARPILAERLIADLSAQGQTRHVESPQTDALRAMPMATTLGQVFYTLPKIAEAGNSPCTNQWGATSITNAPSEREHHTAVWTGSEMIVWGGSTDNPLNRFNTGGRYNPGTDSWTAISITNAPSARYLHTAVWTGRVMIVWGGSEVGGKSNTGGRYNPTANSWRPTSTTNAPSARDSATAVWTGTEMIVWGGLHSNLALKTGGRYNPSIDSWRPTSTTNAPSARGGATSVWTGSEMIIWGGFNYYVNVGNTGGRYNPGADSWTATSTTDAPSARVGHTAVWTGSEMIVWGGAGSFLITTGGRYNANTNSWRPTSTTNAPPAREEHTAVWTGSEMIVWGGWDADRQANTGGRYNPSSDSWTATRTTKAPTARHWHTAVWTGSEMIVWGGAFFDFFGDERFLNTGGRYCGQYPTPTPPNDDFADAIVISATSGRGSLVGTNKGSTTEVGEPAGENSVWYRWTAPNNGEAHFRIGMDWLTIDVYTGTAINALTRIATSSGNPSSVHWTAVAGTTYWIRLTKNTRTSAFGLAWSL